MEAILTLTELLCNRTIPNEKGITYITGEHDETTESYVELFHRALRILNYLQAKGIKQGDELVIQLEDNRSFLSVFWGAILGGIIPVPVSVGSNDEHRMKLFKIYETLNNPYLIVSPKAFAGLEKYLLENQVRRGELTEGQRLLILDKDPEVDLGEVHLAKPEDLAFIQFSSGSTGDPKGVMLTHANVIANIKALALAAETTSKDSILGWMPLTHDMGMILFHLTSILTNIQQYLMPTDLFIRRPTLWLKKASQHKITKLGSPNFGYKFFLNKYKQSEAKEWDLSNVRIIYNGAEPISTELCDLFLDQMEKHGLKRNTIVTGYGLAEASLGVSMPSPGSPMIRVHLLRNRLNFGEKVVEKAVPSTDTVTFVAVGQPIADCHIRICDEKSKSLHDDIIGHIQIKGLNVTKGYYNNPEATKKVLTDDGWVITGDLGFMREGQLVITGRQKDIIFINGQNVYPHDIERVAEQVEGVELGKVAVCGAYDHLTHKTDIIVFVMHTKSMDSFLPVAKQLKYHLNYFGGWPIKDIIPIRKLPKTTSGKVQRYKLAQDYQDGIYNDVLAALRELNQPKKMNHSDSLSQNKIEEKLLTICTDILQLGQISVEDSYFDIGANSLQLTQITEQVEREFGIVISVTDLFSYPNIAKLAEFIADGMQERADSKGSMKQDFQAADHDIAIIGMSGKFPMADDLEHFWSQLANGMDCIGPMSAERQRDASYFIANINTNGRDLNLAEGGYLEEIDKFDPAFFKITPKEASVMDPNQRLFLQSAWSTLENAGYGGEQLKGRRVGVYVGFSKTSFEYERLLTEVNPGGLPGYVIGNLASVIPSRISYLLDLKGPAVAIDTACSSSLVAIHMACQAIRNGECEMALTGGVKTIMLPVKAGIGMESNDDRSRAFDDSSDGTGWGEGVGTVLLKSLRQAEADGDNIYAVIKGSAINQDGNSVGISAPNTSAQTDVILQAWKDAGIDPATLSYIEAHGTGTRLGDPIEISGIKNAFLERGITRKQFVGLGSVKANIGHLYESAGIAGLLKVVLALRNKQLPPLVHFEKPNRNIQFEDSPLYVNTRLSNWETPEGTPRRSGISSFGFSGTNCHIVVEEYIPAPEVSNTHSETPYLLVLSAKTEGSLTKLIADYHKHLTQSREISLGNLCATAALGRMHWNHRVALIIHTVDELIDQLAELNMYGPSGSEVYAGYHRIVSSTASTEAAGLTEQAIRKLSLEADPLIRDWKEQDLPVQREIVKKLGTLYVQGAKIDWTKVFQQGEYRRIPLPTYPFERKRCWIETNDPVLNEEVMEKTNRNGILEESKNTMIEINGTINSNLYERKAQIREDVKTIIQNVSQLSSDEIDLYTHFLELGLDSIILSQVSNSIKEKYQMDIPMRVFFESLTNLESLSDYIVTQLPEEKYIDSYSDFNRQENTTRVNPAGVGLSSTLNIPSEGSSPHAASASSSVERIVEQQLMLMSQQLELLRTRPSVSIAEHADDFSSQALYQVAASAEASAIMEPLQQRVNNQGLNGNRSEEPKAFQPYRKMNVKDKERLTEKQEKHIWKLIQRLSKKNQLTKEYTQQYRGVYANNRSVAGFRPILKELVYQIISQRAVGSKIWDLDENEYIDLTMGFGVNLFGHMPPFIQEVLQEEINHGMCLGPMSNMAGQVAQEISNMTGVERVAFYNSGTEAIMVALRLARAATSRSKVVLFAGSYHGTFDGVLALPGIGSDKENRTPLAPGILQNMVNDIVVLHYGTADALEYIRSHAHELAAVLIEPVQSRRPDLQPTAFLKELREITEVSGTALIFDEVITGFRLHPGGAQAWFGIQADLVTYGKVIGGGLPIGIVAGKSLFMNGIDGGTWSFGDDSYPKHENRRTFVAGTFCHHPLSMAAALAVLNHMKEHGADLQNRLNDRTSELAKELNDYFNSEQLPMKVVYFGSLFRFVLKGDLELFFYHMLESGIYIWEGRNCFLSTAHTEEDVQHIVQAVKYSVQELRKGGFLPDSDPDGYGTNPEQQGLDTKTEKMIALTPEQKQIWFASHTGLGGQALSETAFLRFRGLLKIETFRKAINIIVERHEALRTFMSKDGETQVIVPELTIEVPVHDFTSYSIDEQGHRIRSWMKKSSETQSVFGNEQPLFSIDLLQLSEEEHLGVFTFHHFIADGWSIALFIQELEHIYSALLRYEVLRLPDPVPFSDYVEWQQEQLRTGAEEGITFWSTVLNKESLFLDLPAPIRGLINPSSKGGRHTVIVEEGLTKQLKSISIRVGSSLFVTLLSAYKLFLHRLTGQNEVIVGIPSAGQSHMGAFSLIGSCVNLLPVISEISPYVSFVEFIQIVKKHMDDQENYRKYSFAGLAQLGLKHLPKINAVFNMDRSVSKFRFHQLETELLESEVSFSKYELFLNVTEIKNQLRLEFDYNTDLFNQNIIETWSGYFLHMLHLITEKETEPFNERLFLSASEIKRLWTAWRNNADTNGHFLCVLDEYRYPSPLGTIGEVYQASVTEGVLGKTGKCAYVEDAGDFQEIGGVDRSVLIRGHRLNLERLEKHIQHTLQLEACVLMPQEDRLDSSQLIAYFSPNGQKPWSEEELKKAVTQILPDYTQPRSWIQLDKCPVLPNGEPDLKAIFEMGKGRRSVLHDAEDRFSTVEFKLLTIWQDVLNITFVNRHDNFFAMGGDSLKATVMLSRVSKEFNVQVPFSRIFELQTIAELAAFVDGGSEHKYEPIVPIDPLPFYPLSPSQRRMYVLNQIGVGMAYHVSGQLLIEGELDVTRFLKTVKEVILRHESFLTYFELEEGELVQKVHNNIKFEIPLTRLSNQGIESKREWFLQPFHLDEAPLFRAELVEFTQGGFMLLMNMHHIIADGYSMAVFLNEIIQHYEGRQLAKVPFHYKDFVVWQKEMFTRDELHGHELYWLKTLEGELPALNMPVDFPRPKGQSFEGSSFSVTLNPRMADALYELAKTTETTLFMVLLAAYNVLLSKYTGQEDIIVGSPVAGRWHADTETMIGMFVNTLALRNQPLAGMTFNSFLEQVKQTTLSALDHQEYPFDELVDRLGGVRDLSRNPIFDTMFSLQNTGTDVLEVGGVRFIPNEVNPGISKFDFSLHVTEKQEEITFTWEYSTTLFKLETMQRLAEHFVRVLEKVTQNAAVRLDDICLLSEEERQTVLNGFNDTYAPFPQEATIHGLFEEQAAKVPNDAALIFGDQRLSYRELNEKSNRLARSLRAAGVGPDHRVGILTERSLDMVVGIFAILKAGGAYVPVDPFYPQNRISYILEDSGTEIVLTQTHLAEQAALSFEGKVFVLDDALQSEDKWDESEVFSPCLYVDKEEKDYPRIIRKGVYHKDGSNLNSLAKPQHAAYVIYTSGSTGNPKGVIVEHRSVINRIMWMQDRYGLSAADTILQKTAFTFDVSVWELFWWAIIGSKVSLLAVGGEKDPQALLDTIARDRVSTMHFVPAMLHVFLEYLEQQSTETVREKLGTLRWVFASGEALSSQYAARFHQLVTQVVGTKLINLYGPTETTVDVSYFECDPKEQYSMIPIGKPIQNIRLYILKEDSEQIQPVGVVGELCISGVGVARGYLNRPELTAEKFVVNPFVDGAADYERMYRTGDMARWLPDGNIEYLGRMDHQVKVRGFRIELGEVEAQLMALNDLQQAVVVSWENEAGHHDLSAYFVASKPLNPSDLRSKLQLNLPTYMIPAYFVQLDCLPLTASGKIDRRALPKQFTPLSSDTVYTEPRNDKEIALAAVWEEVLGHEKVGIHDNFFLLGGDSIKAIQVVARLRQRGFSLDIRHLLEQPSIELLSGYITALPHSLSNGPLVGQVSLTPIQRDLLGRDFSEIQPVTSKLLLAKTRFDETKLRLALNKLLEHHDALRLSLLQDNGLFTQIYMARDIELFTLDVISLPGEESEVLGLLETECLRIRERIRRFEGPRVRAGLFHMDDVDILYLAMDQLLVDPMSWGILLEDFSTAYGQALNGEAIVLPDKSDAYQSWAASLEEYANSKDLMKERNYWRNVGLFECEGTDSDNHKDAVIKRDMNQQYFQLSAEETHQLLTEVNQVYNTVSDEVLLAILGYTLAEWSGQERIAIQLEDDTREAAHKTSLDVSRTVGQFTSVYPVVLEIGIENNMSQLIKQVKESVRQVPHRGMGYGVLKYVSAFEDEEKAVLHTPDIGFRYIDPQYGEYQCFTVSSLYGPLDTRVPNALNYSIYVSSRVVDGKMVIHVSYDKTMFEEDTVEKLLSRFKTHLLYAIDHCLGQSQKELTPSDVGAVDMKLEEFEDMKNFFGSL